MPTHLRPILPSGLPRRVQALHRRTSLPADSTRRLWMWRWCAWVLASVVLLPTAPWAQGEALPPLRSPDGRIEIGLQLPPAGTPTRPSWAATFRSRSLLVGCDLGLETAEAGDLLPGTRVVSERRRSVRQQIPVLFGRSSQVDDAFDEARWTLESTGGRRIDVVFRAYDDAIALRYEVPAKELGDRITLLDEHTSFRLAGDPTGWVQTLEHFHTSHEHAVEKVAWGDLRRGTLIDLPTTFSWPDGTTVAITEAALRRYAGMALMRLPGEHRGDALVCRLTPRPDGTKVVRSLPMATPWRVVLVGDRPGVLLESGTLYALNEPTALADTSWIQPGKITFHWWNGDVYDGRPGEPILSLPMARKYIDFCAANGLAAHSLTSTEKTTTPWYHQTKPGVEPGPDTDVTRPRDGFDLRAIRQYAASKGVRLWTWVHQGALRGRVEEAFTAFEKLGWSGLMVDFFDHDDQETVEFAESVLEAAARHHLLVHLHGVWKPTGWQRTYPNLMNHEGALNLEYLKWSDRCPPEHDLRMAFTRLVAGPMDYHLGGFRAVPRDRFQPRHVAPNVLGTRGHMLAMYVCWDNPMPMVADYPAAYESQPGFDFLRLVPTWWDETRVVLGEIGEVLVTARRKGSTWYLGALSAGSRRELTVPLTFLPEGRFTARLWKDGEDVAADPNRLALSLQEVSAAEPLVVTVAPDGGFVAELVPIGPTAPRP